MKVIIFGLLAFISLFSSGVFSEIYQWTDADGNIQFGDRPPPSQAVKRIELEINSYESVTIDPFVPFKSERRAGGKSIVMYSTSWCGYCRKARNYMQKNNISFTEYDIEKSEKGKRDYKKLNGRGVPIILIGDKRMNGFDVGNFERLYGG